MKPSYVTDTLYTQMYFRDQRQKIIANNIANANTPGYKTKDSVFLQAIKTDYHQTPLAMRITHPRHIPSDITPIAKKNYHIQTFNVKGLVEQNDGNNVNLDKQMSESSKNSMLFNAISSSAKKDISFFKAVLEASSKN